MNEQMANFIISSANQIGCATESNTPWKINYFHVQYLGGKTVNRVIQNWISLPSEKALKEFIWLDITIICTLKKIV